MGESVDDVYEDVGCVTGFVGVCILIGMQARLEEQHLLKLHGDSYADYVARVGRLIPKLWYVGGMHS